MRFLLAHIRQRTAPTPLFLLLSAAALIALDITQVDAHHYVESQRDLFLAINGALAAHPFFWLNVTQLGDALVLFPLLSFLLFKSPRAWAALFATAPIAGIFSSLAKSHFAVPRPAAVLTPDQIAIAGPVLTAHNSLPSGHTITIFAGLSAVSCVMAFGGWGRRIRNCILFMAALGFVVGLSRVAVGAHWPGDVLLGAALGIIAGLGGATLACRYTRWWAWMTSPKSCHIHAAVLATFCLALLIEGKRLDLPMVQLAIAAGIISAISIIAVRRT